ncbi:MAG: serine/threonine-protein kinase [Nitriliruptorales bacterium]
MTDKASWDLLGGDEIVPGRTAVKRLGGGTLAEAYLASDDRLLSTVVVKLLRPDRLDDRSRQKLREEADVLRALNHPMIPRLVDADPDGERPHLALEHIEGPRLSTLLRRYGPLSIEQIVPLAIELCSALHYMHGRGYVHLDVKPGNIVMSTRPRLIDMSVARPVERAAALREPVGTDAYMAPEQCDPTRGEGLGTPADVWGTAVTVFEAATGQRPFPPGDERERFPQLRLSPEPPPPSLPSILGELLASCMRREPGSRPSAGEASAVLEPLVAALPRRPVLGNMRPRLTRP